MTSNSTRFYRDLPVIHHYSDMLVPTSFHEAPDDWITIIADIVGSTKAVGQGQYKIVNMLGAACITAAVNVYHERKIAFVFGGDGATLLIPPDGFEQIRLSLGALQQRARQGFGLELRVGAVPVRDLKSKGSTLRIAKLELSPGNYLSLFAGGGVALAERLVKSQETAAKYRIKTDDCPANPDLSRLSCRWKPLAAQKGVMIALLIMAHGRTEEEKTANYTIATEHIAAAIGELPVHAPANELSLQFGWPPPGTALEARMLDGAIRPQQLYRILLQSAFQWAGHKFGMTFGDYNAPRYKEGLKKCTDYRRFDDMIRLVLDCSPEDVKALEGALAQLEARGLVSYGIHTAPQALMTCLLFDLPSGRRIHFIDADEGGFTLAASQLKAKLERNAS